MRAHTEAYRIYDKELGSVKIKCILDLMQISSIIPFSEFRIFQDGFVGITLNVNWNQPITSTGMVKILKAIS